MANSTKKHINLVGMGSSSVPSKSRKRKTASQAWSKKGGKVGYVKDRKSTRAAK